VGKFFLGGAFLGAVVTWTVMHVLGTGGVSRADHQRACAEQFERGKQEGAAQANASAEARIQEAVKKEHDRAAGLIKEKDGQIEDARSRIKDLGGKLAESEKEAADGKKKIDDLGQEVLRLQGVIAGKSRATHDLLRRRLPWVALVGMLWRNVGEASAILSQARVGWPDVATARKAAAGLEELIKRYVEAAQAVRVFIDNNSKELLGEEIGRIDDYREGVTEGEVDRIRKLGDAILAAVGRLGSSSVKVDSEKDDWTDTDVLVEQGDIIHIRADGRWRMTPSWEPSGPDGWDAGGQYRIASNVRTGALIMRIGVSDEYHAAYLGVPIIAEARGRVKFRINDKDVANNRGIMAVDVASANPALIEKAVKLWEETSRK